MGFDVDNLDIGFMSTTEPDGGRSAASIFGFDDEESPFATPSFARSETLSEH